MKQRTRSPEAVLVLALAAVVVLSSVVLFAERQTLEAILIRVNDRIMTVSEFRDRLQQDLMQLQGQPSNEEVRDYADQLLNSYVNEMVLLERAQEKGIVVDEEAIDQAIDSMRQEQGMEDDEIFRSALKDSGLTEEDLRERYARSFMIQRAAQGEIKPAEITEEELRMMYQDEKESYAVPEKVRLEQMIFKVAEDGSDVDDVARRASAMLERVDAGADLQAEATLAGVSLQDLGDIPVQDLRPELREMLDDLGAGEFAAPAVSPGGIQVLRLVERIPAGYQPFEEVESVIRRREMERLFNAQRNGFVEELKKNYLVEVFENRMDLVLQGIDLHG